MINRQGRLGNYKSMLTMMGCGDVGGPSNPAICSNLTFESQTFINSYTSLYGYPGDTLTTLWGTLIKGLVDSGSWYVTDAYYVLAGDNTNFTYCNLKNPTANQVTVGALGSGNWTQNSGITGDNTAAYWKTNFNLNTMTYYTPNSARIGLYYRTNRLQDRWPIGIDYNGSSTALTGINPRGGSGNVNTYINSTSSGTSANADSRGYFTLCRATSSANVAYATKNATSLGSNTCSASPGALPARDFWLCGTHWTPQSFDNGTIGFISIGGAVTVDQIQLEYNAVQAYMTSIGANV